MAPEDQALRLNWVQVLHERGKVLNAVDKRLGGRFNEQQMKFLLIVGFGVLTTHSEHDRKPSIGEAIEVLNFEAPLPFFPIRYPRVIISYSNNEWSCIFAFDLQ